MYLCRHLWVSNCKRFQGSIILATNTNFFLKMTQFFLNQISVIVISIGILLLVFAEGKFKKINFKGLLYSLIVASIIVS